MRLLSTFVAVLSVTFLAVSALAQPCTAMSSFRFANGMCNQTGTGELRPGSNLWSATVPLIVSASNMNTSPEGCLSSCNATARAAFGDLSFVASGHGNNCSCGGIFLWIDEWIGGAPKAETWDRVQLSSATLPIGTLVQIRVTMTFLGGGAVNDTQPVYAQSARVTFGGALLSLSEPGVDTSIVNAAVGQTIDLYSRLYCTMQVYSLLSTGVPPRYASVNANLRLLTDIVILTPDVVGSTCGSPACRADMDDGTGTGTPDGGVTIDDLLYYLNMFSLGTIQADIDDGSGTGTPDSGVTIEDLLFYLIHFAAGC